jgi:hypothetical protein
MKTQRAPRRLATALLLAASSSSLAFSPPAGMLPGGARRVLSARLASLPLTRASAFGRPVLAPRAWSRPRSRALADPAPSQRTRSGVALLYC